MTFCPLTFHCYFSEDGDDDDDDPEYNFLEDLDEPDLEDYRNDRAVRITSEFSQVFTPLYTFLSMNPHFCNVGRTRQTRFLVKSVIITFPTEKEVNELMEELFETVK